VHGEISEKPIIINSGYRSPQLNKKIGGVPTSNHLTGCAVDIHVTGLHFAVRPNGNRKKVAFIQA
jgi:uncharacterized protein YcbK (DUF882 family)